MGLGDWRLIVALLSSFVAKENSVATLGILFGSGVTGAVGAAGAGLAAKVAAVLTPAAAAAFLVVQMTFIPCVATMAAIRQESRSWRWTGVSLALMLVVAFVLGVIVYQVGSLLLDRQTEPWRRRRCASRPGTGQILYTPSIQRSEPGQGSGRLSCRSTSTASSTAKKTRRSASSTTVSCTGTACSRASGSTVAGYSNSTPHIDRLYASAQTIALEIPLSRDELIEAMLETIRRNDVTRTTSVWW